MECPIRMSFTSSGMFSLMKVTLCLICPSKVQTSYDNLSETKQQNYMFFLFNLQLCARIAPGTCPEMGLVFLRVGHLCTLDTCLVFLFWAEDRL